MNEMEAQTNFGPTESDSVHILVARLSGRDSPVTSRSQRTKGGVAFEWEVKPGTPKNLPEAKLLPPLSPPPALQSAQLGWFRHRVKDDSAGLKVWLWRWIPRITTTHPQDD
ncbi:hypothetical protein QJS10_CPA05g01806 [Acorus calamus]|uniref:Uncharacterized protein n=1 Tax=Acorus calamus TaxID=4465 RepID=A0AAV9EVT7_ACOCL|nr:hypothetical protein QJS10_CPA05g01806 [Acorus calamus]